MIKAIGAHCATYRTIFYRRSAQRLREATSSGTNATDGSELEPLFSSAAAPSLTLPQPAAANAFNTYSKTAAAERATFLRAIATGPEAVAAELVDRPMLEHGLSEVRLRGETGRTRGELDLFAAVIEDGSWQNARIDTALPHRKLHACPDFRSMR